MGRAIAPLLAVSLLWVAACGNGETRTVVLERVVPEIDPVCGAPADARNVTVTARGEFPPEAAAENIAIAAGTVDIDRFPENTRVLEVRVEGAGGEERTIGRTAELELAALADGDVIPIFMAPRRGFCAVDGLASARIGPLAARAGAGVVVAGGIGDDGAGVPGVERYDPARGRFAAVAGSFYDDGLVGATLPGRAEGRVLEAGGPETAYQLNDPAPDEIAPPAFLANARAHHAAVELSAGRVLLIGGCRDLAADGTCDFATALDDSVILDLDSGEIAPGPSLAVRRAGATALLEPDGRVLVSGGVDAAGQPVAQAERISPSGGPGQGIADVTGHPVRLASGASVAPFADGVASARVFSIAPDAASAVRLADASAARLGATITALEDGAVVAIGGAGTGATVSLFAPARGRFSELAPAPFELRDQAAVRLDDGTLLLAGGRDGEGAARSEAWIYRHDLTGGYTAEFNLAQEQQGDSLTPRDPSRLERITSPARYRLQGSAGGGSLPSEWLVAAGPRFTTPKMSIGARVERGGLAVLLGFRDARHYHYVELSGGSPARLWRVRDGMRDGVDCSGEPIEPEQLAGQALVPAIEVSLSEELAVAIDGRQVLACVPDDAIPRGLVGVGVIGDGDAAIELASLVARR